MMRDINDIFRELQQHPDYIGGVIWTVEDLKHHIDLWYVSLHNPHDASDIAKFAEFIDMDGWEDVAIEDGWEVIHQQYNALFPEDVA
jgi:hypothetical protein